MSATTLDQLRPGDETEGYDVLGHPTRQCDGQIRVPVRHFDDPWRDGYIVGDGDEYVVVVHRAVPS